MYYVYLYYAGALLEYVKLEFKAVTEIQHHFQKQMHPSFFTILGGLSLSQWSIQ